MTSRLMASVLAGALAWAPGRAGAEPLRVFLRCGVKTHNPVDNGTHDYPAFLADWSKILLARGAAVDGALHVPSAPELLRTDVLVIYAGDGGTLGPDERAVLLAFVGRGGGLVVLHDGMCSDDPEWFATLAGGAKQHGERNWSRGRLRLRVVDRSHPLTRGLSGFSMDDEAFYRLRTAPGMHVLLEAPLPSDGRVVPQAWTFEKDEPGGRSHRAFVWMQGHFTDRFLAEDRRDLILRGIAWTGHRPVDELLTVRDAPAPTAGAPSP